jgi:hypothetical protein
MKLAVYNGRLFAKKRPGNAPGLFICNEAKPNGRSRVLLREDRM